MKKIIIFKWLGWFTMMVSVIARSYHYYFNNNWFNMINNSAIVIGAIITFVATFIEKREKKMANKT